MDKPITRGLKRVFIIHLIISGLAGIQHLLFPRIWTDLAGMEIIETVTWRVIGAALIAFAVSSWLALKEIYWQRIKIIVIMNITWSILGAIAILHGILVEGIPSLEWVNVFILSFFAIAFLYYFIQMNKNS